MSIQPKYNYLKSEVIVITGCVFSIEEFSIYDGPGIRTTVFLKGCPLSCKWCHNPEGQNANIEIVRNQNGCIGCNKCVDNAVLENGEVRYTEKSIGECPKGLLRFCGEITESAALCEKILKNRNLLKNGGVTFSGGEPLFQSSFLFECLKYLRGKLHTAVQTSGYCDCDIFKELLSLTDFILFDLKLADNLRHKEYTGVFNEKILENFSVLASSKKEFVVRIPLIPSVTDTNENISEIIRILKMNKVSYVELLPYNKMAGGKYKMLGRAYNPNFDEKREVNIPVDILNENNINFKIL